MSRQPRRFAAFALATALVCGLSAAWLVSGYTDRIAREAGPPLRLLVAAREIRRGDEIDADFIDSAVTSRMVPSAYAPVGALDSVESLAGTRALTDLPHGAYLTAESFSPTARGGGYRLRANERAVTVAALAAAVNPVAGQRVDVIASGVGGGTTTVPLLSGAEVLALGGDPAVSADTSADAGSERTQRTIAVTLRVAADQATELVRADAFAKELRLLIIP
ncbi:MAG: Flp pilus assembly protein CpaB [Solirubrobacterales bacterium]